MSVLVPKPLLSGSAFPRQPGCYPLFGGQLPVSSSA